MDMIKVEHVTKDFGSKKGIFDVTLCVRQGEVFGYLGPNGAGKSTTIRQLMGFLKPDRGKLLIMDKDCFWEREKIQRDLGYLAGEIAFMDDMTGNGYLDFMASMKGITDKSRMKQLMEQFELNAEGKIRKMSKGMKQKIGIVCAFMGNPKVVILDEPTSGLDPLMQNRFVELILEEKKKGTTIFMSSHIFEEVEKTCDRTAIIREGRIVDIVDMTSLAKMKKREYVITLRGEEQAKQLSEEAGISVSSVSGNRVSVFPGSCISDMLKTISKYEVTDMDVHSQSLEEWFLHYYREEAKG